MNLPKFLYAEDLEGDREFVIHNHWPRFIMEFVDGQGTPHLWDPEAEVIKMELAAGREPAATLARLMREAGDFFVAYHRSLDEFDED